MSSDDDDSDLTPECLQFEASGIIQNLLPEKSKELYLKAYNEFNNWRTTKGAKSVSESVLLVYFEHLSRTNKSSSLWCIYSKLRSTISIKHNVEINSYSKLLAFLKRKSEGHRAKKSKVLTAQNVETFLNEAPDHKFLALKVALIFGINGACRGNELVNIKIEDIETHSDELLLVKLPNTKTKRERSFVIRGAYARIVKKYQAPRPSNMSTSRFFVAYNNGKCTRQVIGKNKLSAMPKEIAKYLKLDTQELYTGHCFRRTSATLLADSGADITQIKRHGGWKSDAVAEGYVENSMEYKKNTSCRISDDINLKSPSEPKPSTSNQTPQAPIPSTSNQPPQAPISPTFTVHDLQSQVPADINSQMNATTTSTINLPRNITLSMNSWTNVSNIHFHF